MELQIGDQTFSYDPETQRVIETVQNSSATSMKMADGESDRIADGDTELVMSDASDTTVINGKAAETPVMMSQGPVDSEVRPLRVQKRLAERKPEDANLQPSTRVGRGSTSGSGRRVWDGRTRSRGLARGNEPNRFILDPAIRE